MASIILNLVVMGREIIEATKEVAGSDFVLEEDLVNGRDVKKIGQNSEESCRQLIIRGNERDFIDPNMLYTSVSIASYIWPGPRYAVAYTYLAIQEAIREFASKLQEALLPRLAMDVCRFSFEGKEYFCSIEEASYLGKVVLADGTVLEIGDWSDAIPSTPRTVRQVAKIPIATVIG